jgi:hypothetical protein
LLSADKRCSFAIAGATPSVIAASLGLIPDRRASGFITSTLILVKTYIKQQLVNEIVFNQLQFQHNKKLMSNQDKLK